MNLMSIMEIQMSFSSVNRKVNKHIDLKILIQIDNWLVLVILNRLVLS